MVVLGAVIGILASLVQFLGLIRWPFLVPYLARVAGEAGPDSPRGQAVDDRLAAAGDLGAPHAHRDVVEQLEARVELRRLEGKRQLERAERRRAPAPVVGREDPVAVPVHRQRVAERHGCDAVKRVRLDAGREAGLAELRVPARILGQEDRVRADRPGDASVSSTGSPRRMCSREPSVRSDLSRS